MAAAAVAPLGGSGAGFAQALSAKSEGPVQLMFSVPVPVAKGNKTGGMYAFDISFVDQATRTYYLGDRSNAAVDVVNTKTGAFRKQLFAKPAFAGATGDNDTSGPNGVAVGGGCIFAGDGPSRVVSFTLKGDQVSSVSTGGKKRADEMAFDPRDRLLIVANNADAPPFSTLLSVSPTCKLTVGKKTIFNKVHGVDATNGVEQSQWDPITARFFVSVPQVGPSPQIGGVARVNPRNGKIESVILVPFCQPAGLSIGQDDVALLGCSVVFDTAGNAWSGTDPNTATPYQMLADLRNGLLQGIVPGVGASDEVWYNSGDNHFYTGSSKSPYAPSVTVTTSPATPLTAQGAAVLGVIDGSSQSLDQLVPTFNVPAVTTGKRQHVSGSAHSVAVDAKNNRVFVPLPANNAIPDCLTGCIGVYGRLDSD